jgi:hypothetical protein
MLPPGADTWDTPSSFAAPSPWFTTGLIRRSVRFPIVGSALEQITIYSLVWAMLRDEWTYQERGSVSAVADGQEACESRAADWFGMVARKRGSARSRPHAQGSHISPGPTPRI